ncbi:MAG: PorT family protein [Chitinophagales bacterium]|nr:PorT family protein [Chitinophagales bacterium]
MKNLKSILVVACLFIVSHGFSQVVEHKRSEFGINAGLNFTNVNITTPSLTADSRTGYQAGIFYRSGKFLYGQAGLNYQLLRNYYAQTDTTEGAKDNFSQHNLQLPLYVGINLAPILRSVINVRAYAGPVFKYTVSVPVNGLQFTLNDLNKFGADVTFGAGLDVLMFSVDAGYSIGLNEVFDKISDAKNNYGFITVGLRF